MGVEWRDAGGVWVKGVTVVVMVMSREYGMKK